MHIRVGEQGETGKTGCIIAYWNLDEALQAVSNLSILILTSNELSTMLLLSTFSAMLCYLDLYGTMSLL